MAPATAVILVVCAVCLPSSAFAVSGSAAVALLTSNERQRNPRRPRREPGDERRLPQAHDPVQGTATQNPHDEVAGQPGYTPEGKAAAQSSDLSFADGAGNEWTDDTNPWTGYALHLALLFEPAETTAWYGDGPHGACMGTGDWTRYDQPAFFSLPGDRSSTSTARTTRPARCVPDPEGRRADRDDGTGSAAVP